MIKPRGKKVATGSYTRLYISDCYGIRNGCEVNRRLRPLMSTLSNGILCAFSAPNRNATVAEDGNTLPQHRHWCIVSV